MNAYNKKNLAALISAIVFGSSVAAQDIGKISGKAQAIDKIIEEINIVGIAPSLREAAGYKRDSSQLVDVITSTDVGKFPDENIAESLQRISGVQIRRSRGEGQAINIRGLPSAFTLTQFNGRELPSAARGGEQTSDPRSFDFAALPSEFVRTLEVLKSPTADLPEGGLSGTVKVRTVRPFDLRERVLSGAVQGSWNSNSGDSAPRISGLYSDVYADGRFGLAVGAAFSQRKPDTYEQDFRGFTPRTEADGFTRPTGSQDFNNDGDFDDTIGIPTTLFHKLFDEERERTSAFSSLQFSPFPDKDFELFADAFYSEVDISAVRYENIFTGQGSNGPILAGGTQVTDPGGSLPPRASIFQTDGVDLRGGSRTEDSSMETYSFAFGGHYKSGLWAYSAEIAASESEQIANNLNLATIVRGRATIDTIIDDQMIGVVGQDGFAESALDPQQRRLLSLNGDFGRTDRGERVDFRFDVDREIDSGVLSSVEFGVAYSDAEEFHDRQTLFLSANGINDLVGGLASFPGGGFSAATFMQQISANRGTFLEQHSGPASIPTTWLSSDTLGFLEQYDLASLLAAGATIANDDAGTINVSEKTTAGYIKANFGNPDGSVSGNFGLRVVSTKQSSVGVAPDLSGIRIFPDAGEVTTVPGADQISGGATYTEWLPSLNLKINLTDDLVTRFSASRTLARPTLATLSPSTTVSGVASSVVRGNPNLDPFASNNFDISFEYYFGDGNYVSITPFYKEVTSLVRSETSTIALPITLEFSDGSTSVEQRDFTLLQPENSTGVSVSGVELAYQQQLTFLPIDGFGIIGNYTYIDNSDPKSLTGSSQHNFNMGAFYETDQFEARVSYTWRDEFLTPSFTALSLDNDRIITEAYGQLDANITYRFNDNVSFVLEAVNILDEAEQREFESGPSSQFLAAGQRVLFGVRGSF